MALPRRHGRHWILNGHILFDGDQADDDDVDDDDNNDIDGGKHNHNDEDHSKDDHGIYNRNKHYDNRENHTIYNFFIFIICTLWEVEWSSVYQILLVKLQQAGNYPHNSGGNPAPLLIIRILSVSWHYCPVN